MKTTKTTRRNQADKIVAGFRISDEPVVGAEHVEEHLTRKISDVPSELPPSSGGDLLYIIARDPKSLFVYWDLDWTQLFARAGLSVRQLHLRTLRADGSEEGTIEINPFLGYCFVEVTAADANYSCELGCFEGSDWKSLIRSGSTATPAAEMSDDLDADFATVPFHLSFQRLVDMFRAPEGQRRALASSVAAVQEKTRALRQTMPPADWSRLVDAAANLVNAEAAFGLSGVSSSDFATFLRAEQRDGKRITPSPEMRERWKELGERFGGLERERSRREQPGLTSTYSSIAPMTGGPPAAIPRCTLLWCRP